MIGNTILRGHRVLVVEDDYFIATETARAIEIAGAQVLGPCPSEDDALDEIAGGAPTTAVLDFNLGRGLSFDLARTLKLRGIPLVFISGYDEHLIPADFEGTDLVQKPFELRQIVTALAAIHRAP